MKNLLLEQRGPHGSLKTWRLNGQADLGRVITFGSSKHADLRSPDTSVRGMHGYFEFKNNTWKYYSLNLTHENQNDPVETSITGPMEIKMGSTIVTVKPFADRENIVSSLGDLSDEKTADKSHPFQIFTVTRGELLLETRLVRLGGDFTSSFDATRTKLRAQNSSAWMTAEIGPLQINQRTIHLASDADFRKFNGNSVLAADEKIPLIATLAGAAILALLFLISPNAQNAGEVAMSTLPPAEYRQMKLAPAKKKKVSATQAAAVVSPEPSAAPAAGKSQSNALSAIRNLGGASRLSKLLGKVAAGSTKSANVVIVANGVVAGTASSGRALAAIGNSNQNGKDWGSESKGANVKVTTVGVAGGKGTGGMGNLATGKTGTGGAELLEDESEIVGGLDRDIIAGVIRGQLGQILYCYERQLSASPDLYGKVAVRFTIGPKGEVETERIGDSTLRNATVEGCILQKVARWKFPAPEGGTKVTVTYPFLFKSTN